MFLKPICSRLYQENNRSICHQEIDLNHCKYIDGYCLQPPEVPKSLCMHATIVSDMSNETRNLKYTFKIIAFRYLKFKRTRLQSFQMLMIPRRSRRIQELSQHFPNRPVSSNDSPTRSVVRLHPQYLLHMHISRSIKRFKIRPLYNILLIISPYVINYCHIEGL